ncbi:hypothetical protein OXX59_010648, partial [Metschnikowia pulcherrima]
KNDAVGGIYSKMSLETLLSLSSFQIVSLFLMLETARGTDSFWKPFIDMLPEIEELSLCPLVWKVMKMPQADKLWAMLPRSTRKHSESVLVRFEKDMHVVSSLLQDTTFFLDKNLPSGVDVYQLTLPLHGGPPGERGRRQLHHGA